jgi:hypothetical protein
MVIIFRFPLPWQDVGAFAATFFLKEGTSKRNARRWSVESMGRNYGFQKPFKRRVIASVMSVCLPGSGYGSKSNQLYAHVDF